MTLRVADNPLVDWRRAAAILFLFVSSPLFSQDEPGLGKPYSNEEHEFTLKPPAGWIARQGRPPAVVLLTWTPGVTPAPFLEIIHKTLSNPAPLSTVVAELNDYLPQHNPGFEKLWEKEALLSGRAAYQVAFKRQLKEKEPTTTIRTILPRTHLEYFFIDFECPSAHFDRLAPAAQASLGTFTLQPGALDDQERAALARGDAFLKSPGTSSLASENWYSIHIASKRFGYQRMKAAESSHDGIAGYALETDLVLGRGSSGTDTTSVRGFVAGDFSVQKFELDEVVKEEEPKRETRFHASALLKGGELRISRDMNGVKEEKTLAVGRGVLLTDTMDLLRRRIVDQPKGVYLFRTISLFADEQGWESLEVAGKDKMSAASKEPKEVFVLFSKVGRRKNLTYWLDRDRSLYAIRGPDSPFSVIACPREEAESFGK